MDWACEFCEKEFPSKEKAELHEKSCQKAVLQKRRKVLPEKNIMKRKRYDTTAMERDYCDTMWNVLCRLWYGLGYYNLKYWWNPPITFFILTLIFGFGIGIDPYQVGRLIGQNMLWGFLVLFSNLPQRKKRMKINYSKLQKYQVRYE